MVESCVAPTIVGLPTYFVRFVPTFCPRNYLPVYIPYRRVTRPIYYRDAEEISTGGRVGRGGEGRIREKLLPPPPLSRGSSPALAFAQSNAKLKRSLRLVSNIEDEKLLPKFEGIDFHHFGEFSFSFSFSPRRLI